MNSRKSGGEIWCFIMVKLHRRRKKKLQNSDAFNIENQYPKKMTPPTGIPQKK